MKLFKKTNAPKTLQELQQEFNQTLFQLGEVHYRKAMVTNTLTELNAQIQTINQKLDGLGKQARAASEKMQAEVKAQVKKGEATAQQGEDDVQKTT